MSARDDRWAELSSGNERLIRLPEPRRRPDDYRLGAVPPRWAELASQDERLAEVQRPLAKLAGSRGRCDLRHVAGAA